MITDITQYARLLGFEEIAFIPVEPFTEPYQHYLQWIKLQYYGEMSYLYRYQAERENPKSLAAWAKTAVVVLFPYLPKTLLSPNEPQVAKFAYHTDYHYTLKSKLHQLLKYIQSNTDTRGRCVIDTAPLLERSLAAKAGLGWIGKSGMLIHPKWGTFTLIGTILLESKIENHPTPQSALCGECCRCIEACPGNAIIAPKIIDARKCISYLTIEYPRYNLTTPQNIKGNYFYGCDVCQDICPHNQKVIGIDRQGFSLHRESITKKLNHRH